MKAKILGFVMAALLAGSMTANAAFMIDSNNSNEFDGTFTFTGDEVDNAASVGGLLPTDDLFPDGELFGSRAFFPGPEGAGGYANLRLFSEATGSPDDPFFARSVVSSPESFPDLSGLLDNSKAGVTVYWSFSDLNESSGGADGVFSGAFCFSTSRTGCTPGNVPEPGTLALLGFGLASFAASRRRKR